MRAKPLVAHVLHSLATGGLENGVVNLVLGTSTEINHAVVCLTSSAGAFARRLPREVPRYALGKRPGQDPQAFVRLVRLFRQLRPQVVHSRNWAAFDAVLAARLARVPVVVHGEHGRDISDPEGRHSRRNTLRRLLSPLVTRFVTVSDDLRRWLVSTVGIPAYKVTTIRNGVDLAKFAPADRAQVRRTLALPVEARIVGTVGRLDPVKDHVGLVEAFRRIAGDFPDAALLIVGDGPCRAALLATVEHLGLEGHVRLLGEREDVPRVLGALDVFALPSIAEGISNTILEAMASGLPVIATRVGGNPELVEDEVTGVLVPPRDPPALASAITRYFDDPGLATTHGKAGRQRAEEHFSLPTMCRAYAGLYQELTHQRGL